LLRHLVGLGERPQVERADLFSAWRLFFERMSDTGPVVLVFEDLHSADTALLDFIEHLLEWSRARPIFVLALTRPELLERRGGFGSHGRSSTTMVLELLSDEAIDELLDGMVPGLPDEVRSQIRTPTGSRSTGSRRCGCYSTGAHSPATATRSAWSVRSIDSTSRRRCTR
jgi:hypothetical protein